MIHLVEHPLIEHALAALRNRESDTEAFRKHTRVVAHLLAAEVMRDLALRPEQVQTPLAPAEVRVLAERVIFVPVLRAGLAMLNSMADLLPASRVGFVGLERDERTAIAREYYAKLPAQLESAVAVILDPMVATGGSSLATIRLLRERGARAIRLACIVAAREGLDAVQRVELDVPIYACAIDPRLDERKFIVPGLGDFGDRYWGTD